MPKAESQHTPIPSQSAVMTEGLTIALTDLMRAVDAMWAVVEVGDRNTISWMVEQMRQLVEKANSEHDAICAADRARRKGTN